MELAKMKISALLMLVFVCDVANAWQAAVEQPNENNKNKVCIVGSSGTYIRENDECIDTQAKCEAKNGQWGGYVSGRGRSPGCSLPTKDAGKKCSDSSQCESLCVAHDMSNQKCSCYDRTVIPKGQWPDQCSFKGVVRGPLVD
jgi:hypothetical protein